MCGVLIEFQSTWAFMYVLFIYSFYLFISTDRIPVGPGFSVLIQTGSGPHPPSYAKGTGFFRGLKRLGRGVNHSPPFSAEVKERVEFIPLPPSLPSCQIIG
jgi:hypothetical protein